MNLVLRPFINFCTHTHADQHTKTLRLTLGAALAKLRPIILFLKLREFLNTLLQITLVQRCFRFLMTNFLWVDYILYCIYSLFNLKKCVLDNLNLIFYRLASSNWSCCLCECKNLNFLC